MKPPCEVVVKDLLPAVKAMVAKNLAGYGLSQRQIAEKLGTTQPAISQYKRDIRGKRIKIFQSNPKLLEKVSDISKRMAQGMVGGHDTTLEFCKVCRYLVSEGVVCELHKEMYQSLSNCDVCSKKKDV